MDPSDRVHPTSAADLLAYVGVQGAVKQDVLRQA